MKRSTSVQLVAILAAVAGVAGCGGDAGVTVSANATAVPNQAVRGTVLMPNGRVAAGPVSPLERFAAVLLPAADAMSANVSPVGAGVQVTLVLLHADGSQDPPAATAVTNAQGQYAIQLPAQTGPDTCRYIVEVGSGASLTRAFVTTTSVSEDIDYASEAEVRLLMNNVALGDNLCNYTSSQLNQNLIRIRSLPGEATGANAAEVNDSAYEIAATAVPPIFPPYYTPTARPTTPTGPTSTPTNIPPTPAPTFTHTALPPTPTNTTPPAATPTNTAIPQPPCTPPAIQIEFVAGTPGTQTTITAILHTGGASVAGTQNDITFDPEARVNAKSTGKPNCTVNADINKGGTSFAYRPSGCTGDACTTVRALVVATDNTDPIPDGSVLYTCVIDVASVANTTYPLTVTGVVLSDPVGNKVPNATGCSGAVIAGNGPTPTQSGTTSTATPTPTTPAPTVTFTNTPVTPAATATFTNTPVTPIDTPTSVPTTPVGASPTVSPTPSVTPVPPTATATATFTIGAPPSFTPGTPGEATPTFAPRVCNLKAAVTPGVGTGAVLSAKLAVLGLPLSGSQVWRFGPLEADSTRKMVILPSESHFDCATASFAGQKVKICARVDPTTYCHGGPNDGLACPPADCGAGNACDIVPGQGVMDCAAGGGNITTYDSLVQIDHNTNQTTVGGKPNIGLPDTTCTTSPCPLDPTCINTFVDPDGAVLYSCLEPASTAAPTVTTGPGTPTPTPVATPTARAAAARTCSGSAHPHPNVCNSPTEQTFSGSSPAGGFKLHETIDLSFEIGKDCSTACPPDSAPKQDGDLQIAGDITSGHTKGIIWQVANASQIMGTTGPGNGAAFCNALGADKTCITTASGVPIDLSSVGGSCLSDVLPTLSGATLGLAYPAIDLDPTIGDFIATLTLQCE